jgi:acetyl esterase
MPLDPQVRVFLDQLASLDAPGYPALGVEESRRIYSLRADLNFPAPEVGAVFERAAEGPLGAVPLRVYRGFGSAADAELPALIYFHGGGWVLGDLDTHDAICRELANLAQCAVLSVAYRLAPEYKFPQPLDDAIAAARWIAANAQSLGIDPSRIAVGGDSAGATLAAVVAHVFRSSGGPRLTMQILFYPPTDLMSDSASHLEFAQGYGLTRESVLWFRDQYLRDEADADDWRASPLRAPDHRNLPPAYVLTAGYDTLRDEGRLYAEALQRAGVTTTYECFEGMIHGFINLGRVLAGAHHALYRAAQALKIVFEPPRRRRA